MGRLPQPQFEEVATSFTEEANRQRGKQRINARPGSEYANATVPQGHNSNECRVNATTGVRIHKSNPKGVPCENTVCSGLPRSLMHDLDHCMQPGGGMEGKAPWRGECGSERGGKRKDIAAAATESKATPAPPPSSTETTALATSNMPHSWNWSCAVLKELANELMPKDEDMACIASQLMSTILDSGTTSTLITDRSYFWTYNTNAKVTVETANHQ